MQFYANLLSDRIRFGDILSIKASLAAEIVSCEYPDISMSVEINSGDKMYFSVLTPCCTMAKSNTILLSPLMRVNPQYFATSGISDNILKSNIQLTPKDTIPDIQWAKTSAEEQEEIDRAGLTGERIYFRMNEFLYDENDEFGDYEIGKDNQKKTISYYTIDFCNIHSIGKKRISITKDSIKDSLKDTLWAHKVLELTPYARRLLRLKLAEFYRRPAPEDQKIIGKDPLILDELQ